jgi:2-hydroxy-6-oxonona-2,4-dienedioate hydrolase
VHGLAIGSSYFGDLARALRRRGISVAAPDLPGCGASRSEPVRAGEDAERLVAWFEAAELEPALWVGHSNGCQLVDLVAQRAPAIVRGTVHISPIWHRRRHPWAELAAAVVRDIPLERLDLVAHAAGQYWDTGLFRLWQMARYFVPDAARRPLLGDGSLVVTGAADPLVDLQHLRDLTSGRVVCVDGPHGVVRPAADALAEIVASRLESSRGAAAGRLKLIDAIPQFT